MTTRRLESLDGHAVGMGRMSVHTAAAGAALAAMAVVVTLAAAAAVLWAGPASATTVHEHSPQTVIGKVSSVSGGRSCGSSGTTGSFTVPSSQGVFTVDVTPVTVFKEHKPRTTYAGAVRR